MRTTGWWKLALAVAVWSAAPASAQDTGTLRGVVVSAETGEPLPGARIKLVGSVRERSTVSADDGAFRISPVPTGHRSLVVSLWGYRTESRDVEVAPRGNPSLRVEMTYEPLGVGAIEAVSVSPDLRPAIVRDPGSTGGRSWDLAAALRALPGVGTVRRGPTGFDPVLGGLREAQLGAYVDGARVFSASPLRTDSPFGLIDPSAVASVEVVTGPYAVAWGAGTLSAIRLGTPELPVPGQDGFNGAFTTGYASNVDARETSTSLRGRSGPVAFWAFAGWRAGNDYQAGDGRRVEGDFEEGEARAKLSLDTGESTRLIFSGGYGEQLATDHPGALLSTEHGQAVHAQIALDHAPGEGPVNKLDARVYYSRIDQDLDDDGKPTAMADASRDPSEALYITADPRLAVWGGRMALTLDAGHGWEAELGGDLYTARRRATRKIRVRDDGERLFTDLLWPEGRITNGAPFLRISGPVLGPVTLAASVRTDFGKASVDTVGDFYAENVATSFDETEVNWSGALSVSVSIDEHWRATAGAGSVSRIAGPNERFSDRTPSTRTQLTAEFVGNPVLEAERSNQLDLWIEADYPGVQASLRGFVRRMDNYVTIAPTEFEPNLPFSPATVYRYVSGEARFRGFDAAGTVRVSDRLAATVVASYVWGWDDALDEPAFGVPPFNGAATLRYDEPGGRYFVQGTVEGAVRKRSRDVSPSHSEASTDGYAVSSLAAGVHVYQGVTVRAGVENLFDRTYVDHLSARNPFTGARIPEIGRMFFARIGYTF